MNIDQILKQNFGLTGKAESFTPTKKKYKKHNYERFMSAYSYIMNDKYKQIAEAAILRAEVMTMKARGEADETIMTKVKNAGKDLWRLIKRLLSKIFTFITELIVRFLSKQGAARKLIKKLQEALHKLEDIQRKKMFGPDELPISINMGNPLLVSWDLKPEILKVMKRLASDNINAIPYSDDDKELFDEQQYTELFEDDENNDANEKKKVGKIKMLMASIAEMANKCSDAATACKFKGDTSKLVKTVMEHANIRKKYDDLGMTYKQVLEYYSSPDREKMGSDDVDKLLFACIAFDQNSIYSDPDSFFSGLFGKKTTRNEEIFSKEQKFTYNIDGKAPESVAIVVKSLLKDPSSLAGPKTNIPGGIERLQKIVMNAMFILHTSLNAIEYSIKNINIVRGMINRVKNAPTSATKNYSKTQLQLLRKQCTVSTKFIMGLRKDYEVVISMEVLCFSNLYRDVMEVVFTANNFIKNKGNRKAVNYEDLTEEE